MSKAYEIRTTQGKPKGVIYADHNAVARRVGASLWGNGDFMAVTCKRAPWADEWEGAVIPWSVCRANNFKVAHPIVKWLVGEA